MNDGFPTAAFIPFLKQHPELFELKNELIDNYDSFYKHLGIFRDEMMLMMQAITSVDVLSGTDDLKYASNSSSTEASKNEVK